MRPCLGRPPDRLPAGEMVAECPLVGGQGADERAGRCVLRRVRAGEGSGGWSARRGELTLLGAVGKGSGGSGRGSPGQRSQRCADRARCPPGGAHRRRVLEVEVWAPGQATQPAQGSAEGHQAAEEPCEARMVTVHIRTQSTPTAQATSLEVAPWAHVLAREGDSRGTQPSARTANLTHATWHQPLTLTRNQPPILRLAGTSGAWHSTGLDASTRSSRTSRPTRRASGAGLVQPPNRRGPLPTVRGASPGASSSSPGIQVDPELGARGQTILPQESRWVQP